MLEVPPYLFCCFVFQLTLISEVVSPVRLKFYETLKSYCVQSFQNDNVYQTGHGLVVTLK